MEFEQNIKVVPIGRRVLIRKQEDRKETQGGILLPDSIVIPQITGTIIELSVELAFDSSIPLVELDKVLFNPSKAIPVDLETDRDLFVVDIEDVIAVFKKVDWNERD